ncbi:ubiquinol cytochrome c reductase cytochrome c1 prec [Ochromonadaceae sp. CCMP2298]|nr:ubiquinol cytochrome c reductase cytochrome c1 prec [Ochromonadaceae sp. CCMP2298]|mmetsp:Transcript_14831/g.32738  ORF Transcript_14831/g.32738 Transcript_14831/m.32738 type:complete len:273 (-) Transcript_14831:312-1130(-)
MFSKLFVARAAMPMAAGFMSMQTAKCSSEDHIPSLDLGWSHHGALASYDYASIRRGFQVYRQVCSSCHSVDKVAFRSLVGVTHSEEQMKKIAESYEIEDGPNDQGEMFERPGKLSDLIPGPYKNEEAGRAANGGAYPPDLSLIVKARHDGIDYLVALLTGYVEAPAGKAMLSGLYYNPYFPGGAIAMPKQLVDGQVEYEDGTAATETQMAKDVATFLAWAGEPEHDDRKKSGVQFLTAMVFALVVTGYYKRFRWSIFKTRKITYTNKYTGWK